MPVKFTLRGYLDPPERQDLSIEEVEKYFVEEFPDSTTRKKLFEGFKQYNIDFQREITPKMIQWIGGSFISRKINPRDIDVVTIIPHYIFDKKENLIDKSFRKTAKETYGGVDAYIVSAYPKDHEEHRLSKGILVYWGNQLSGTRRNRAGKKFKRGYVQIIHQKFSI